MARGRWVGQYELVKIIGQGETLTQYRAHDTERDRPVILRLPHAQVANDANLIARFRRRAEELLRLQHPRIVPIIDASFEKDALYLVTDIPGDESLERLRAGQGPLVIDDVLSIISQVAEALDYAHAQGVFHHDVRPANIYVKDDIALLTDFFLLEAIGATPTYMAPEQLDETSAEAADRRSDAYALGVIVYEKLTGRPPFEGDAADVAAAHLTQRPLPPRVHNPDLIPALDAIVLKALAKQPEDRFQSAGELVNTLQESVRVAQTRRMFDSGVFAQPAGTANETTDTRSSPTGEGGIPLWAWVGLGIFLVVVITTAILLATR